MPNFFANFDVVVAPPNELLDPSKDIEAKRDHLGGYLLQVNRSGDYFRDIFGEQREFTKHERQQIKLFAIGSFLKCHTAARREYLPEVEDADGVDIAIARLAEGAVERGEL